MNRILFVPVLLLACQTDDPATKDDTDPPDTDVVAPDDTDVDTDPVTGDDTDPPTDSDTPEPAATVVLCPVTLPPAEGVCDVTPGTGGGTVIRGDVLGRYTTWDAGTVVLDAAGEITCVGCDCDADPAAINATVITCPDGVISPGLINPHDHITFSENPPLAPSTTRYQHRHDWRGSLSTPGNPHGTGSTGNGNRWVEVRQLMGGTTSMVGSGGSLGLLRNPDQNEDYHEGADIPVVENETFPLNDSSERQLSDCSWSYKLTEYEVSQEDAYIPHIAEGINDRAHLEFECQSTSFGGAQDYTEANAAHIHSIGLYATDYFAMAEDNTTLVWSPRSNISLYGFTADVATFHRLGGKVALGTDWTYSGSAHPVRELACADGWNRAYLEGLFTDRELWLMSTWNAAVAVGAEAEIGELAPGKLGDIAIFNGADAGFHRAVIEASSLDVALVLRGGEPLFGEADTLAELGDACDTFSMCTQPRAVCLTRDLGISYAALASAVPGAYPAFFCGTPPNEPTCVPSRPGEFNGQSTAGDVDGDGEPNASDSCPTVFNPPRPMDDGAQPDADGDGLGDPCDPTPLADDIDGDGVVNADDTCPLDANPSQADADSDGKGDLCDACVDTPNPTSVCPPAPPGRTTIPDARQTLADGTRVLLQGVVTGVSGSGFALQDPSATDGVDAGIWVFVGSTPPVTVGTLVDVIGELDTYFDERQLTEDGITLLGPGPTIVPIALTAAAAAAEDYEGTLVTVSGTVTDAAYDCSVDGACTDANLWEIDGATGVLVYDRVYEDADWVARVGEVPVTGVMGFRWERRRVMPRTGADWGP
jgi:cytosine/adenosine deaminase-related metal-dependent hydrolase